MPHAATLTLVLLASLLCWKSGAAAQVPLNLRVDPLLVMELSASSAQPSQPAPPSSQAMGERRMLGRQLATFGAGLMAAGVTHAALFSGKVCYEDRIRLKAATIAGSVTAGIGLGLAIGGGVTLGRLGQPYLAAHRPTAGKTTAMVFAALGTALFSAGLLVATTVFPYVADCTSS